MSECKRCGRCCLTVGRTFWKTGNLKDCAAFTPDGIGRQFYDNEELNQRANDDDHEDNGLPCEMLEIIDGLAICKIERDYGIKYKPSVCKDYPEENEKCFRELSLLPIRG